MMNTKSAVLVALAWRILRSSQRAHEFYQSLEVAHHAVFGYGHLTWEWSTSPPIRSAFFPSIYMPVYWLLKVTGLDSGPLLVRWLP